MMCIKVDYHGKPSEINGLERKIMKHNNSSKFMQNMLFTVEALKILNISVLPGFTVYTLIS